jgi:hypothetical protein
VRNPDLGITVSDRAGELPSAANHLLDYRAGAGPHFFPEHRCGRVGALRRPNIRYPPR